MLQLSRLAGAHPRPGESGLLCLAAASQLLGQPQDFRSLRSRFTVSYHGLTVRELVGVAQAIGLSARTIHAEIEDLRKLELPAILQWGLNEFVVLVSLARGKPQILDPTGKLRTPERSELNNKYTGVVVEVTAGAKVEIRPEEPRLNPLQLIRWDSSLTASTVQAVIFSIVLQLYILVSPLYLRIVLDSVANTGDLNLLDVLTIGFALFAVFNAGASALRGVAIQKLNSILNWQMSRRLFRHMLKLQLSWFQGQRLADLLTRLQGLDQVRTVLSNGLGSALDGVLSIATLGMLAVLAPTLALACLIGFIAYICVRLVAIPITMRLNNRAIQATAAEQGKRIETLRAIQTIKAMAVENDREHDWSNKFAETIETAHENAAAQSYFTALQALFTGLTMVAVLYLGAKDLLAGKMTVGLLMAAWSYQTQFTQRAASLFEQIVSWKLLDVPLGRLSGIAQAEVEPGIDMPPVRIDSVRGAISVRGLSYKYEHQSKLLLRDLDLDVGQGEHIAIVGPSGCGKTTLLKLIIGLYRPLAGEVCLDGRPLEQWGPYAVRRSLGVVMQDDELFAGSISENVSFFDEQMDLGWVWTCLGMAAIDEDVRNMPAQLDTLVGDMGASLSGGQKQRLLLARALYRKPRILVLDEATSHLDVPRERTIVTSLKGLDVTRIIVAHRPETIAAADKVYALVDGRLERVPPPGSQPPAAALAPRTPPVAPQPNSSA